MGTGESKLYPLNTQPVRHRGQKGVLSMPLFYKRQLSVFGAGSLRGLLL